MECSMFDRVYDTVKGVGDRDEWVEGVENLFLPGSACENDYFEMLDAYERLCERLGVQDEDADVEKIIRCFMDMERRISRAMFECGVRLSKYM